MVVVGVQGKNRNKLRACQYNIAPCYVILIFEKRTNLPFWGSVSPADMATQLMPVGAAEEENCISIKLERLSYWGPSW